MAFYKKKKKKHKDVSCKNNTYGKRVIDRKIIEIKWRTFSLETDHIILYLPRAFKLETIHLTFSAAFKIFQVF